jgi:hypothetical protein
VEDQPGRPGLVPSRLAARTLGRPASLGRRRANKTSGCAAVALPRVASGRRIGTPWPLRLDFLCWVIVAIACRDDLIRRHTVFNPMRESRVNVMTTFLGAPATKLSRLSINWSVKICMARALAQAMCGVSTKLGKRSSSKGLPERGGSTESTSNPAPPMRPARSASASACSSTRPPRTRHAPPSRSWPFPAR